MTLPYHDGAQEAGTPINTGQDPQNGVAECGPVEADTAPVVPTEFPRVDVEQATCRPGCGCVAIGWTTTSPGEMWT